MRSPLTVTAPATAAVPLSTTIGIPVGPLMRPGLFTMSPVLVSVLAAASPTAGAPPRDAPLNASPVDVPACDVPLVCSVVTAPLAVREGGVGCTGITVVAFIGDVVVVVVPPVVVL